MQPEGAEIAERIKKQACFRRYNAGASGQICPK